MEHESAGSPRWYTLEELCERLGIDRAAVHARAGELAGDPEPDLPGGLVTLRIVENIDKEGGQ
ncbi:MAG: hypothetical protein QG597_3429 [Actinomycetota bacterium]|jgi:hypothetical protein|nr:hypothetical protein [Actinomycetota bacterium]